mgnify:CR=1 FL=1
MKKKLLILITVITVSFSSAYAWGGGAILGSESYLSIGTFGGPGALMFSGDTESPNKIGFAFGFSVDYSCYINKYLGFTTGMHIFRMSSGYKETNISSRGEGSIRVSDGISSWYDDARYHIKTGRIDETYKTVFLEVPVMLAFQYQKWYWNMGMKVAVPISMNCDYTFGNSKLYLDEDLTTGTSFTSPGMFIREYSGSSGTNDLYDKQRHQLLVFYVMASLEAGYNVAFYGGSSTLTVGAFVDVSLNGAKLNSSSESPTITLDSEELTYNNSLSSGKVNTVTCFKAGIKLQYNIGIGHGAHRSTRGLHYL